MYIMVNSEYLLNYNTRYLSGDWPPPFRMAVENRDCSY